ncbi:MAG: tRNA lysidine(34) synthetase TilS [gamma proteobacterium symbiont of Bathyaustriella thionipta]|nr:tRNA lysidine(34) synthetase TilS [gamma proteobacterium symbiont of Bathyaustriella thionipta]MCU7949602.1 tRNA lysidine(34) synthetase TilS [gamma proteobacterium symbiont of Bathyaustriella thionipta]MCU7953312.1 tRNA lysidine(34) synthetase TilS [gamma proteobacterium symbiont of Bathyaustriella thionipta]MCU7956194.1 tRNA lysidine(34) synthetase TilS [gamma proteobacterium symbiont of Bathyaustriella thionipta]MCU7968494.1 tRNA lysidine(34) synthetase TilS [gamma proteobacterium symbion
MSVTPQAFHFHLQQLAATEKYLIAYSGGVDSHVLLHLCSQLKNAPSGFEQSFSAVYIDHGLSSNAKKWGFHCQHICFELDIPLTIIEVDARPKNGQSPEASARTARYQAFSQLLDENECLLTAQHLDDQAETLLLQLLRGSGTKGLSAMPRVKPFSKGLICRPILDYRKQDILDYARQHQLDWIEDESNAEERFDRNYLRHKILPLLEKRWPAVQENFSKSAEVLAESQMLLDEMAHSDIQHLFFTNANGVIEHDKLLLEPTFQLLVLSQKVSQSQKGANHCHHHELARLNNLLRYWINLNKLPMPSKKILEQIVHSVIQAREDAMPLVSWRRDSFSCEVRRYRNKLYLLVASSTIQPLQEQQLIEGQEIDLNVNNGSVKLIPADTTLPNQGFEREKLLSKKLIIGYRKGGERYRRTAKEQSHTLKHWFQEQGIPPWEREQMPLVFWGDELIQVGNYVISDIVSDTVNDTQKNKSADNSLVIHWQRMKNK